MKTTELFVEQVLIGLAVLVTVGLMVSDKNVFRMFEANLGTVAVAVAGAYFSGIVFDRLGDTLLGNLEQHHRLQFALEELEKAPVRSGDPFPEDQCRVAVMFNAQASDYAHYLRSRIRLTRALAALTPALSVAVSVQFCDKPPTARPFALALVAVVYAASFLLRVVRPHPGGAYDLPRTDELLKPDIKDRYSERVGRLKGLLSWGGFLLRNEPVSWSVLLLAGGAAKIVVYGDGAGRAPAVFVGAVALPAVCGWCWWRITGTYYAFLRDFSRFAENYRPQAG